MESRSGRAAGRPGRDADYDPAHDAHRRQILRSRRPCLRALAGPVAMTRMTRVYVMPSQARIFDTRSRFSVPLLLLLPSNTHSLAGNIA
jgi:hypothetical protein